MYGLMSDDTALFAATLDSMSVRFYGARHENNAIAMAKGYAPATGKLGLALPVHAPRATDPRSVASEINRMLAPDRNAVFDAGNFLQVLPYIALLGPAHLKNAHDLASIGIGIGLGFDNPLIGKAFGFQAATVCTLAELRALAPLLEKPDGPIFIDCEITASVVAPFLLETTQHERYQH